MKVKKILKEACNVLELDDIATALDGTEFSQPQQTIINKLLKYFNSVQNEIATEFFLQKQTEQIQGDGKITFDQFSKDVLKVSLLKNDCGENI